MEITPEDSDEKKIIEFLTSMPDIEFAIQSSWISVIPEKGRNDHMTLDFNFNKDGNLISVTIE